MSGKKVRYIGASETAALFDAHPYMTRFQLWHIKKGNFAKPPFAGTDRSFWGDILEPAIAEGFCRLHGYEMIDFGKERFRIHPTIRQCCANLDFGIYRKDRGFGLLECKSSDLFTFRDEFPNGNPPLNYELQLQQEMMCEPKASYAFAAVLVGGNDLKIYERQLRPVTVAKISEAIESFWQSIDEDAAPPPDYSRDGKVVASINLRRDGSEKDFRGNNYLNNLCYDYLSIAAEESDAGKRKEAIKCEIMDVMGKASWAKADGFDISATIVPEAEVSFTRKPYVNLTIKERK